MLDTKPASFEALLLGCSLDSDILTLWFDRHLYPACEAYGTFHVRFHRVETPDSALEFFRHFIGQNIAIWMIPHFKGFQLIDYYYDVDWYQGLPEYPELYCQYYSMTDEPYTIEYLKSIIEQFSQENSRLENENSSLTQRHGRQEEQVDSYFREEIKRTSLKADGVADDQAKAKFLDRQKTLERAYKAIQFIREKTG